MSRRQAKTRGDLILAMAKRARTPSDCQGVGRAIAQYAGRVDDPKEMEKIDAALGRARETMDAYKAGRVLPMQIGRGEKVVSDP